MTGIHWNNFWVRFVFSCFWLQLNGYSFCFFTHRLHFLVFALLRVCFINSTFQSMECNFIPITKSNWFQQFFSLVDVVNSACKIFVSNTMIFRLRLRLRIGPKSRSQWFSRIHSMPTMLFVLFSKVKQHWHSCFLLYVMIPLAPMNGSKNNIYEFMDEIWNPSTWPQIYLKID